MTKPTETFREPEKTVAVGTPDEAGVAAAFEHLSPAQRIVVEHDLRFVAVRSLFARRRKPEQVPFTATFPMFFDVYPDGEVRVRLGKRHVVQVECDDHELLTLLGGTLTVADRAVQSFPCAESLGPSVVYGICASFGAVYGRSSATRKLFDDFLTSPYVEGRLPAKHDPESTFVADRLSFWRDALRDNRSEAFADLTATVLAMLRDLPTMEGRSVEKTIEYVEGTFGSMVDTLVGMIRAADSPPTIDPASVVRLVDIAKTTLRSTLVRHAPEEALRVLPSFERPIAALVDDEAVAKVFGRSGCDLLRSLRAMIVDAVARGDVSRIDLS